MKNKQARGQHPRKPAHATDGVLSESEVIAKARAYVAAGRVAWHTHAEGRLAKHGFDKGLAKQCLLKGLVRERPHPVNRHGAIQYEFTVRAVIERQPIEVVATLKPEIHLLVITVKPFKR
jgi:hypothetical protein